MCQLHCEMRLAVLRSSRAWQLKRVLSPRRGCKEESGGKWSAKKALIGDLDLRVMRMCCSLVGGIGNEPELGMSTFPPLSEIVCLTLT